MPRKPKPAPFFAVSTYAPAPSGGHWKGMFLKECDAAAISANGHWGWPDRAKRFRSEADARAYIAARSDRWALEGVQPFAVAVTFPGPRHTVWQALPTVEPRPAVAA